MTISGKAKRIWQTVSVNPEVVAATIQLVLALTDIIITRLLERRRGASFPG
jgi:hypothetical protein